MATRKAIAKPAKEKRYIVLCNNDLWVTGTKLDIMEDFDNDPDVYIRESNNVEIYELGEPIPFSFVTPQITF